MTDSSISIIEKLPSEIFHKILDHLKTTEMFYSLNNVCRRMNAFLISYNRYELDFSSLSRFDFNFFHSVIHPKNIISLTLSDDDRTPGQIGLFLSLTDIQEFRPLRSLALLQIEERHLIIFLQRISHRDLRSLTIKCRSGPRCRRNPTQILSLLSSIISQSTLRYLNLDLWNYEIKDLTWPTNCTARYLQIDSCSSSEICFILCRSPRLNTLILHNCSKLDIKKTFLPPFNYTFYEQLLSLSLEKVDNVRMNMLQRLLLVTPSLVYLKLIGFGQLSDGVFDGSQWEHFIEHHLLHLNKFQFFITTQKNNRQNADDLSPLIIPFSNNFWLQKKRWFIICDFIKSSSQIRLYSIPICQPHIEYASESNKISYTTLTTIEDDVDKTDDVRIVNINLSATGIKQNVCFE
jgi:hypothetical protein